MKESSFIIIAIVFLSCNTGNTSECGSNKIGLLKDELSFSTTKEQLIAKGYGMDESCDCYFKIEQVDKHMVTIGAYLGKNHIDSLSCTITYNGSGEGLTTQGQIEVLDSIAKEHFYYEGAKTNSRKSAFTHFELSWNCGIYAAAKTK